MTPPLYLNVDEEESHMQNDRCYPLTCASQLKGTSKYPLDKSIRTMGSETRPACVNVLEQQAAWNPAWH